MSKHTPLFRRTLLTLAIITSLFISSALPIKAAGYPSLTYVRFNRYGGDIYATYCIAADSYSLIWGEYTPSSWQLQQNYGAISGCTTKYLFSQVQGNEDVYVDFYTRSNSGGNAVYWLNLYPRGSSSLTCSILRNDTRLVRDPRLVSSTACAFWDQ